MSMRNLKLSLNAFLAVAAVSLLGCNGMGSNGAMGTFNLSISDTPVDGATSVLITFTGVQIKPQGTEDQSGDDEGSSGDDGNCAPPPITGTIAVGTADEGDSNHDCSDNSGEDDDQDAPPPTTNTPPPPATTGTGAGSTGDNDADDQGVLTFSFPTPQTIDLMKQQGGNSASLLSGVSLPAGHYVWIRLMVAATGNTITLSDGSVHPLTIPSGDESGLKLVHGFTVAAGGRVDFTIDFDLRRSVVLANGQYFLKPVLRITDNEDTGHIRGMVANTFTIGTTAITDPTCKPAAYLFAGDNVTPVDINPTSSVQPVATATVQLDNDTGQYVYMAGFLAPGDYTVALTCAANDNPQTVDNLTFSAAKNATVTADMATEVDFP